MLKRLADKHSDCVAQLTYQYRMHEDICRLSNDIVYGGKLKCANDSVANKKLTFKDFPLTLSNFTHQPTSTYHWLNKAIDPSNAVTFLDTDKITRNLSGHLTESICPLEVSNSRRASGSIVNETEVSLVQTIIDGLLSCGLDPSSIGVICPFRAQLRLLDECSFISTWKKAGLELSTIDRYQGRDKSVIILSFVRSNIKGKVGQLLSDFRRLNVAVTRAKYKLIMIGSFSTLYNGSDVLKSVLERVKSNGQLIELPNNVA
jgi:DNA replication ATP-dependent helicase Dna2